MASILAADSSISGPLTATDVARGVTRMLLRHDLLAIAEVQLDGGRRADLMTICWATANGPIIWRIAIDFSGQCRMGLTYRRCRATRFCPNARA